MGASCLLFVQLSQLFKGCVYKVQSTNTHLDLQSLLSTSALQVIHAQPGNTIYPVIL